MRLFKGPKSRIRQEPTVRILQSLTRLFIILVSLMMSLFSEKMLIINRCISGSMSNLIEKSWKVSNAEVSDVI